ncbi:hypothetical protein BD779DRAFT_1494147 [Infundibulicybe gibba]|nr:hypothetical protein BD779DRAFT_1494147 [Infundibulicybe gibba]
MRPNISPTRFWPKIALKQAGTGNWRRPRPATQHTIRREAGGTRDGGEPPQCLEFLLLAADTPPLSLATSLRTSTDMANGVARVEGVCEMRGSRWAGGDKAVVVPDHSFTSKAMVRRQRRFPLPDSFAQCCAHRLMRLTVQECARKGLTKWAPRCSCLQEEGE